MSDTTTKGEALQSFFEGFGIPAYPSSNVPDDAEFPYLTYDAVVGSFGTKTGMEVNLWYRCDSEREPNAKAQEISSGIGFGGTMIRCEDGAVWITRGTPWCQSGYDPEDTKIKRRYLNVETEFVTLD